jgi:hypothetical protein
MTMGSDYSGQGLKPTWRGLKQGGSWATPLAEFVGTNAPLGSNHSWRTEAGQFGSQIVLCFNRLQVIRTDAPYPNSEVELWLKYSEQKNSAWGRFGQSIADALGVELDLLDIEQLNGQQMHMVRHDNVDFGFKDRNTGQAATGTVWQLVKLLQPGERVTPVGQAQDGTQPALFEGTATLEKPKAAPTVEPSTVSSEQQALDLLDGKNLAEFFQYALPDTAIRADQSLMTAIMNNTFVEAKLATGEVTKDDQGVYHVAS